MRRIFYLLLASVIWVGALLYTAGNITAQQPILQADAWEQSTNFHLYSQPILWDDIPPRFFHLLTSRGGEGEVQIEVSMLEWLLTSQGDWRRGKVGQLYTTSHPEYSFATQWGLDHDRSMVWHIGSLRFNNNFIAATVFLLLYSLLCLSWWFADDFKLETPAEKRNRYDNFVKHVKQAEDESSTNPVAFKKKVIFLASLGYGVIFGSTLLLIPMSIAIGLELFYGFGQNAGSAKLGFFAAIIPIAFVFNMLRTLFSDSYRPDGVMVTAKTCPDLFHILQSLQSRLNGPKFRKVYITPHMNASVSRSHGFWGVLGFGTVVLEIGAPLMQALSAKEIGAVISHEYGHVAARHNALGQWVYRIRGSWWQMGEKLQLDRFWYVLRLNRFYDWFMSRFSGRSFVLSRQCEYEADAIAAELVGKEYVASALTKSNILGRQFDSHFWGDVWGRAESTPTIRGIRPYTHLWQSYMTTFLADESKITDSIRMVEKEKPDYVSTHPTTLERIKKLGFAVIHGSMVAPANSAVNLLGQEGARIIRGFDEQWQEHNESYWQDEQARLKDIKDAYNAHQHDNLTKLSDGDLVAAKQGAYQAKDYAFGLRCMAELVHRYPDNADCKAEKFSLELLKLKDESVLDDIIRAVNQGGHDRGYYAEILIEFFHDKSDAAKQEKYQNIYDDWAFEMAAARDERTFVLKDDVYTPHDIPADTIEQLAACADRYKIIQKVYLAKKITKYATDIPCYIVAVSATPNAFSGQVDPQKMQAFVDEMSTILPQAMFIGIGEVEGLSVKMKKLPNAKIYARKHWWG